MLSNVPMQKNAVLIFLTCVLLVGASFGEKSDACGNCTTVCAILPPPQDEFPCYQGTPEDANFCYDSDPAIKPNSSYHCAECITFGYLYYSRNDPVYTSMELWSKNVSDAVSQAPSASPTAAPTARPTPLPTTGSPTASPSTKPSAVPTAVPSAVPTTQPSFQSSPIVTFQSTLTMTGVVGTSLDAASQAAVINVTATSMGIPVSTVTYVAPATAAAHVAGGLRPSAVAQRKKVAAAGDFTAVTEVNIPLGTTTYTNATLLYNTLVAALATSVDSGAYTAQLHTVSAALGATQILTANVTAVQSSPLTVEAYDGDQGDTDSDDDDDYNLVTPAIVGGACLFVVFLYVVVGRYIMLPPAAVPGVEPLQ